MTIGIIIFLLGLATICGVIWLLLSDKGDDR